MNFIFNLLLPGLLITALEASPKTKQEKDTIKVTVNCDKKIEIEKPLTLSGYFNTSLRMAPPKELAQKVEKEFGDIKIVRCWLTLDDMWDYRTNEYRFNFKIGKDYYEGDTIKHKYKSPNPSAISIESDVLFYDYLDSFSKHSDEIMLNIRRYEHEVKNGIITISRWKEVLKNGLVHYKKRYPNIKYIEILNESSVKHFGGVKDEEYYFFYKAANDVINKINQDLNPTIPLLIGGNSNHYNKSLDCFLKDFSTDSDAGKKIDFVSFHEYGLGSNPAKFSEIEKDVIEKLKIHNINSDIPIFITEMGFKGLPTTNWEDNFVQASFITSAIYHNRHNSQTYLFPWVLYHTPKQLSHVQFDIDMKMTPFGAATKMLTMHKEKEVYSSSDDLSSNGTGLGVLATMNDSVLVIQLWNYNDESSLSEIEINNLLDLFKGSHIKVQKYHIDSGHNNFFTSLEGEKNLEIVDDFILLNKNKIRLNFNLEPMALCIWNIKKH